MSLSRHRGLWLALAWMLGAFPALAPAQGGGDRSAGALEEEINRRDAVIRDLQRRVQALEEKLGGAPAAPPAQDRPPRPAAAPSAADEELLSRALERSLVRSGGILLPRGQWELDPGLRYDHTRRSGLGIVAPGVVASRDIRRDNFVASLGLRAGLPWDSQFELAIPYGYQRIESVIGGTPATADDTGLGDVQIGFSKQLLAGGLGRTGLIGNLTWQHSTGDANLAVLTNPAAGLLTPATSLGIGHDALHASLTAVRRLDPIVFLGSFTHSFNRSASIAGTSIDPSDTNSISLRAILAASPDVSVRTGLSLARSGNTKINGLTVPGSNQLVGLVELGTSIVLTRRTLLDVAVGVGLTQDSPDFVIGVSLPMRF